MTKLSAKTVEKACPRAKEYKLLDGAGLYLRVRTSGVKSWLFLFRLPGSRKALSMTIGLFEDLPLKEARSRLPELRKLVAAYSDDGLRINTSSD